MRRRERNPSFLSGAMKGRGPGITGRITHRGPAALTSTESRPTGSDREPGEGREQVEQAGWWWQIGGEGVMSWRGEEGGRMTGSGGGGDAG